MSNKLKKGINPMLAQQVQRERMDKLVFEASKDVSYQLCACGHDVFNPSSKIKHLTKERLTLVGVPAQTNMWVPEPVWTCTICGRELLEPTGGNND